MHKIGTRVTANRNAMNGEIVAVNGNDYEIRWEGDSELAKLMNIPTLFYPSHVIDVYVENYKRYHSIDNVQTG